MVWYFGKTTVVWFGISGETTVVWFGIFGETTAVPLVRPVWYLVRPLWYVLLCRVVIFVKLVWYFGMTIVVLYLWLDKEQNRTEQNRAPRFSNFLYDTV